MYNDKMYKMLAIAKQSSEMGGWTDKLSATLDSVHKSLEKHKAAAEAEKDDMIL